MKNILFVCTGNIFRSLSAERLARKYDTQGFHFSSAGIAIEEQDLHPTVIEELTNRQIDASSHRQRQITRAILDHADLVVSMSINHKDFIEKNFNHDTVLFNRIVLGRDGAFPDANEIGIKEEDYHLMHPQVCQYVRDSVALIDNQMPIFLKKLPEFY